MRSDRALAAAVLLASCGSVNDLSIPSAPFATVRARVDLAAVSARAAGRPLLAGLVWGRVPSIPLLCYRAKGDPVVAANCPDPFGFFPAALDVTVPVDPAASGDVTFVLDHLPSANVLVGTDVDHVAYASIVVVADTNGNGAINVRAQQQGGRGGGPGGGGGGVGGGGGGGNNNSAKADELLAASFVTLNGAQQRLAFREGSFDALRLFYPLPACTAPPAGFSVVRTGAFADPSAPCDFLGLDAPIEATPLAPADATSFACRWGNTGGRIEEVPHAHAGEQDAAPDLTGASCLPGNNVVVIPAAAAEQCRGFTAYALKGCAFDPDCETPEWDHTSSPPEWWPCAP